MSFPSNIINIKIKLQKLDILDLPKFNNFRTLGIVGSKSGQKGANGTNCANWIKRSEIVWNIMQHDKHAGWWWNMMKPPKPYTIKSKWLGAYSSLKHIQSNITKHPLWGHPLPKVRPAPLLCALFFARCCKIWWCVAFNLSVWWADLVQRLSNGGDWRMLKMHLRHAVY